MDICFSIVDRMSTNFFPKKTYVGNMHKMDNLTPPGISIRGLRE